jgi:hypothetical protein
MSKLIALVVVALGAGLDRVYIQPGEEVTGLNAIDEEELKRVGAIQDQDEQAADEKAAAAAEARAKREFAAARKLELAKTAASE